MTRSDLPPEPEVPESTVSELQALYREAARAEPSAMLDRRILDAAQAGMRSVAAAKARRSPPWWKGWMPVASALAMALIGLSITWQVMDEQERDLRQEMKAAEGVREAPVAGSAAPAQGAVEAPPSPGGPAPAVEKSSRAESAAVKDAPSGVPVPGAMPVPATTVFLPAPAALGSMAPAHTAEPEKKSRRADMDELQERRDAGTAADSVSAQPRQSPKAEANSFGAGSSREAAADSIARPTAKAAGKSAAAPAVDPASPEVWLQQIRDLRAAGRNAEAAQSLARFRVRHPDFALPEDLLNLN